VTHKGATAFGHFVTIWQKKANGMWKVALDVGLDHPQPQEVETEIRTYVPNSARPHSESVCTDLEKAQRSFAESLKDDEGDAIIDNAGDDIRVYRSGQLPAVGKTAAKNYCPTRMQKRLAHHEARAQVTRLISRMNMVNLPASATMLPSTASTFASGALSPMAPGK
jgi:hypothetical protein